MYLSAFIGCSYSSLLFPRCYAPVSEFQSTRVPITELTSFQSGLKEQMKIFCKNNNALSSDTVVNFIVFKSK